MPHSKNPCRIVPNYDYNCIMCDYTIRSKLAMKLHYKMTHKMDAMDNGKTANFCALCGKKINRSSDMLNHRCELTH